MAPGQQGPGGGPPEPLLASARLAQLLAEAVAWDQPARVRGIAAAAPAPCPEYHSFGRGWATPSYWIVLPYVAWASFLVFLCFFCRALQYCADRNRLVLQLPPAVADAAGLAGTCKYVCYRRTFLSHLLINSWRACPRVGELVMLTYVVVHNAYWIFPEEGFHVASINALKGDCPVSKWESLVEPFLIVFICSRTIRVISRQLGGLGQTFFMRRCEPQDAQVVLVDAEDRLEVCLVYDEGETRFFELMLFRFIGVDDGFVLAGTEELTGVIVKSVLMEGGLQDCDLQHRQLVSGPNRVQIRVPGMLVSVIETFRTKMYIYQLACCWWFIFFGVIFTGFTWLTLVCTSGAVRALVITRRSRIKVQELTRSGCQGEVRVIRAGRVQTVRAEELTVCDVIQLRPGDTVPCDCVVARGSVVANESMITGEAVPITKFAMEPTTRRADSGVHMLYAGTQVLETSGHSYGDGGKPETAGERPLVGGSQLGPEEGAIVVACAIGGATFQANLIRLVLLPEEGQFDHFSDHRSCWVLVTSFAALAVFGLAVVYFFAQKHNDVMGNTAFFVRSGFLFFPLFNPMLGVATNVVQLAAVHSLRSKGIACLLPPRVSMAGLVDRMVLDKTGTITEDRMEFHGIDMIQGDSMGAVHAASQVHELPLLAHSLITALGQFSLRVGEVELNDCPIGQGTDSRSGVQGSRGSRASADCRASATLHRGSMQVLRVLGFERGRMMSGCVCQLPEGEVYLFVKGAAASIQDVAQEAPGDFLATADRWSGQSYYVLGCAVRKLRNASQAQLPRRELEAGLRAFGLLLFRNPIKAGSREAVSDLKQGGTNCVMCTGDSIVSGVAIAKHVGLILPEQQVFHVKVDGHAISTVPLEAGMDGSHMELGCLADTMTTTSGVLETGVFAVEQRDWEELMYSPMLPFVLPRVVVFGRMLPEGKVSVVRTYQHLGYVVGMCGDGSNDCAALRAANVGFALSAGLSAGGGASVIAPFSASAETGLSKLCDLLREGRACMATNLACVSYYMAWSLSVLATEVSMIIRNGTSLSNVGWNFIDVFGSVVLPGAMVYCRASPRLTHRRPSGSLIGRRVLLGVLVAQVLFGALHLSSWYLLFSQAVRPDGTGFYEEWCAAMLQVKDHSLNRFADTFESAVSFLTLAFHIATAAVIFSYGSHFREPVWRNWRLALAYLVVLAILSGLLYMESTDVNCWFRVNCDGATLGDISEWTECFKGPQLKHWGDNVVAANEAALNEKVARLVRQAASNPEHQCLPPWEDMEANSIPGRYRDPKAIHNRLDGRFKLTLAGMMGAYTLAMHLLFWNVVHHPRVDSMEDHASARRFAAKADANWESLRTFSLAVGLRDTRLSSVGAATSYWETGSTSSEGVSLVEMAALASQGKAQP